MTENNPSRPAIRAVAPPRHRRPQPPPATATPAPFETPHPVTKPGLQPVPQVKK